MSEGYSITYRVDARKVKADVSAIIQRKVGGITKNYRLYRDIAESLIDKSSEFIPCDSGRLTGGTKFDSHQKAISINAIDKKKNGREYNYAAVQWYGDNGSGVPSEIWNRANNWGHDGHKEWFNYMQRRRPAYWKEFIDDCKMFITEAMNNE